MCNIPDNYSIWEAHDREQDLAEQGAEKCAWCNDTIGDTFYDISGDLVCERCIDGCRRYV